MFMHDTQLIHIYHTYVWTQIKNVSHFVVICLVLDLVLVVVLETAQNESPNNDFVPQFFSVSTSFYFLTFI